MTSLRERKKARTRADLQRHALRLFAERGYDATTADDIAAAAEVSRSTFFRYFATKEDVVLFDDVDPLFEAAFAAVPAGTPMLAAVAEAIRATFAGLDDEKRAHEELRMSLARSVPEVFAAVRAGRSWGVEQSARLLAPAVDREPDDPEVLILAGVLTGARLAAQAMLALEPGRSYIDATVAVLERLADGIPLANTPIVQPS
jgi:AcrR family transcriptional regulator